MSAHSPQLRPGGAQAIDKLLHETVGRKETPAIFFLATNAKETFYANQAGERVFGDDKSGQVDADTVLELFSQTKLVTAIAALQLVDRGLVSLDSEADIAKHLPEIQTLKLLTGYAEDGQPILVQPKNKVTLRMLLSHTSGFTYAFLPNALTGWYALYPEDTDCLHPTASMSTICKPLAHEPDTSWVYGTSSDFAGKLVERVSGLRLDAYFQKNIFEPLGLSTLTFFPTDKVKQNKMAVCLRASGNKVRAIPGGFGGARATSSEKVSTALLSGGAGLFGTQREYLAILRAILQSDPASPHHSTTPLISPNSYNELFTGCVGTQAGKQAIADMVTADAYFDPPPTSENIDHSVGFVLNLEDFPGRRKKGSGTWYGAAHTQYWIDPLTGIAGICATQLFHQFLTPDLWSDVYVQYEQALYAQLEEAGSGGPKAMRSLL